MARGRVFSAGRRGPREPASATLRTLARPRFSRRIIALLEPGAETAQKLAVAVQQAGQCQRLFGRKPADGLHFLRVRLERVALKFTVPPVQTQPAVRGEALPHPPQRPDAAANLLVKLADGRLRLRLPRLDAAADEAPCAPGQDVGGSADQQQASGALDDNDDALDLRPGGRGVRCIRQSRPLPSADRSPRASISRAA